MKLQLTLEETHPKPGCVCVFIIVYSFWTSVLIRTQIATKPNFQVSKLVFIWTFKISLCPLFLKSQIFSLPMLNSLSFILEPFIYLFIFFWESYSSWGNVPITPVLFLNPCSHTSSPSLIEPWPSLDIVQIVFPPTPMWSSKLSGNN